MIPKGLLEEIKRWITEQKYGHLQINFAQGRIVNVNRVESVKVDMLVIINQPVYTTQLDTDPILKSKGTGNP